ncbi:MAG: type II toxin-antitoxin system death-on-curing family toxin [Candidatus Riflebacteria bacterium]|nr:type II toxin-antitoxin system death-on-curing family toxin [Candidatus Riflebacteria bacterium]
MTEPIFLSFEDVVEIHRDQIARYGGAAGVRDVGLLQSAVLMPLSQFDGKFLHKGIFEMAAAYLFHLTMNHPFIDGNKRVGLVAALLFLMLNGYEVTAEGEKLEKLVLEIIDGEKTKEQAGKFLHRHSQKIDLGKDDL